MVKAGQRQIKFLLPAEYSVKLEHAAKSLQMSKQQLLEKLVTDHLKKLYGG